MTISLWIHLPKPCRLKDSNTLCVITTILSTSFLSHFDVFFNSIGQSVCVCVVCMYVYVCVCMHACMYAHMCFCVCVCRHACASQCLLHLYVHVLCVLCV